MMTAVQRLRAHELIDAGDGRRLERFGPRVVDRPAPAAFEPRRQIEEWRDADLRFDRDRGWQSRGVPPEPWTIEVDGLTLELRPTETGQVGWFPEHAALWPWLRSAVADRPGSEVLHLFGYTGATTLALARDGTPVAHVDASRPAIAWARRNAELSGLAGAPVRWIVDDARSYLRREARRGRRYGGIVLDPPSYGHGTRRRRWELDAGLPPLLDRALEVAAPGAFLLLTTHTPGWDGPRLAASVASVFGRRLAECASGDLELEARSGAILPLGAFARAKLAP